MRGLPNSSKRASMALRSISVLPMNRVSGIGTLARIRCMYMLILSQQMMIESGSSITGMPCSSAVREAT